MKVAFCSSEVFPFAKTGGLADVAGALPLALAREGVEVKVFMPLYKGIKPDEVNDNYGITKKKNLEIVFIRNDEYFLRDSLYGTPKGDYPDNLQRFSFYSLKVLELLKKFDFSPDIIHCNDWQSSPVMVYLKTKFKKDQFYKKTKTVLTIHNLAYQGLFDKKEFPLLDLPKETFSFDGFEYYGKINFLKAGILYADMVNTVSPTYSKQITTKDYGCGLEGVLQRKKDKLIGILNAIDYDVWNPKTDKNIAIRYDEKSLVKKAENKKAFQKELGLEVAENKLLFGMVSRLAEQKGVDILSESLDEILKNYQVVILGTGDEKYHKILQKKADKYKSSFSLHLTFDEKLAHKIYAGSDVFLMPSRFEPCGLSQMISYKYATVPLVKATGGLVDTVIDYGKGGGGFVFTDYSAKAFQASVKEAAKVFSDKSKWKILLSKISAFNFSWEKAAKDYMEMYKKC